MKKTIISVLKVSVLLLLAPQSKSSMCQSTCQQEPPKQVITVQPAGIEVDFPLVQTLILDL